MTIRRKPHAVAAAEDSLIRCVRAKQRVARGELAGELGLVPSTIGVYVERLVRDGFLIETVSSDRGLGRPPVLLELNPRCGRFIGVDFDDRRVMGISTDFSQNPLQRTEQFAPPDPHPDEILNTISHVIEELIGGSSGDVLGIGLGLPGKVDSKQGVSDLACREAAEDPIPVVARLHSQFHIPISIENNLRSMALAEYWFGQGRNLPLVSCLGVRSGFGFGMVFEGKLYRGATDIAGSIGDWICPSVVVAESDGPATIRHTYKKMDNMASVRALLTGYSEAVASNAPENGLMEPMTVGEFVSRFQAGDERARDSLQRLAVQHGWVIHHLSLMVDPDLIVIACELTDIPEYMEWVLQTCQDIAGPSLRERVQASQLGPFGGALAAAAIAVDQWTPRGKLNAHQNLATATFC